MNDEINYMLSYIAAKIDDTLVDDYIGKINDYITNLQQDNKKISIQHLETVNKLIEVQSRIEKAVEILKDTNVDMPSTLLIETIDNGINILNSKE